MQKTASGTVPADRAIKLLPDGLVSDHLPTEPREDMILAVTILGSVCVAAIAAVLAHRLTSRRDHANRRSDLRVEYLVSTYRMIADAANRDLDPDSRRTLEQGLSDIQLLGSKEQAEMAIAASQQVASDGVADLNGLLLSLRDDLREELGLVPITHAPIHLRFAGKD